MKICIFVHELLPTVGHSRAMIELINGLTPEQKNQVTQIEAYSCEAADLDVIFPEFKCNKVFHKAPGKNLKPFLLKMFIYHLYSYFFAVFYCRNTIKIGIGIASLNVDISNIQFVHEQWKDLFFKKRKLSIVSYIYKKILFKYFEIGENILFKSQKIQFITIANFLEVFISKRFGTSKKQFTLIPSGVNVTEFSISTLSTNELISYLLNKYPQLGVIDWQRPIVLFVGAFERKGLDRVLSYLEKCINPQLILIGKPESFSQWSFPPSLKIARIDFTREVNLFYSVSDLFIFPTYYEPFGLVILEAYAMGLDMIIPRDNVGASEILIEDEGLYFFNQKDELPYVEFKKLSIEARLSRREKRIKHLEKYTWSNSAQKFYSMLSKY